MSTLPELAVLVSKLPNKGKNLVFQADEGALLALSSAIGVDSTKLFRAKLLARPWKKGGMALKGQLLVQVEQACVVTAEPVSEDMQVEINRKFLPVGKHLFREKMNEEGELLIDPEASDIPDEFSGDTIDLWDVLIEEVVLELNPFPRAPYASISAKYQTDDLEESEADQKHNPFSELNSLINKKNSEN